MKWTIVNASTILSVIAGLTLAGACHGADEAQEPQQPAALGNRLDGLRTDLSLGATGDEVRTVQDYLATYGYLPNDALAAQYPAWRPLVARRPSPGTFDDTTASAVRFLQKNSGIEPTG